MAMSTEMNLIDQTGRLVVTPNPVNVEGQHVAPLLVIEGESLRSAINRTVGFEIKDDIWIVQVDGIEIACDQWDSLTVKADSIIGLRPKVAGGKGILQLVAMVALTYVTFGISGVAGGAYFGASVAGKFAAMGVFMAGSMLINKVLGPKLPSSSGPEAGEQLNSITSSNNQARKGEAVGLLLGEVRIAPDLLTNSYAVTSGDNQYMNMFMAGGVNLHSFSEPKIGEAVATTYTEASIYQQNIPGMPNTDMPMYSNVTPVSGGELSQTRIIRTTPPNTNRIECDYEYTLFKNDGGNAYVNVHAEYRPVGTTAWTRFTSANHSNNKTSAKRNAFFYSVPAGQYEVCMLVDRVSDDKTTRTVNWTSLKAYSATQTDTEDFGCIGLRVRATGQLSGSVDNFTVLARAKPVQLWNGSAWVTATTRANGLSNPGAQILHLLRGVRSSKDGRLIAGLGLSDDQIDIEGLKAFMLHCTANGYKYDRWITSDTSIGDMLSEIALAGFGEFTFSSTGLPTVGFAAPSQAVKGSINMANVGAGSFSATYNVSESADGVEVTFLNRETWEAETVQVLAPGKTTMLNPARINVEGVTDREAAAKHARFHLAQNLYQYKSVTFELDMQAMVYRRLSVVRVSHDLTQWGYSGRMMDFRDLGNNRYEVTLDENLPATNTPYIGLRLLGSTDYTVFQVEAYTGEKNVVTIKGTWPAGYEKPARASVSADVNEILWCADFKASVGNVMRVVSIEAAGDGTSKASVTCVPETAEYWNYVNNGTYVQAPNRPNSVVKTLPVASAVRVSEQPATSEANSALNVSWEVTGDYEYAQLWAGLQNEPLEYIGNYYGNTGSIDSPKAGNWVIEVVPYNSLRKRGQSQSVIYNTVGVGSPVPEVLSFEVTALAGGLRRFNWTLSKTPSLSGVKIRFKNITTTPTATAPTAAQWDSLEKLAGNDLLYTSTFDLSEPKAGTYWFVVKAVSSFGETSENVFTYKITLDKSLDEQNIVDLTPPQAPSSITVDAILSSVTLSTNLPQYTVGGGHKKVIFKLAEITAARPTPTYAQATETVEGTGATAFKTMPVGKQYRVWALWETNAATQSSAFGPVTFSTSQIGDSDLAADIDLASKLADGSIDASKLVDGSLNSTKFAPGLEPVGVVTALPTTKTTANITFNGELYTWDGTKYSKSVKAADITGTLTSSQIANNAVTADKIASGQITAAKMASGLEPVTVVSALPTTKSTSNVMFNNELYTWDGSKYSKAVKAVDITGTLSANQIAVGAVTADKLASGLEPVTIVTSLPTTKSTSNVTFNGELYTWDGTKYSKSVKAVDITGEIVNSQIANNAINANKLANNAVTADKLAANSVTATKFASGIEPVSIVTTLPTTKSTTNVVFNNELYTWDGSKYSKAVKTADLQGTITENQIAVGAVTGDKLATNTLTADKFATGVEPITTVTALPTAKTTSNVIFNNELYTWNGTAYTKSVKAVDITGTLATAQIADSAINANKLASNAVTNAKIASNAVTEAKIASGAVSAAKFASGIEPVAIVTTLPTTKSTSNVMFNNELYTWNGTAYTKEVKTVDLVGTVEENQIAAGAVTAAKLAANAVDSTKFASGIEPITVVSSLPTAKRTSSVVFNNELYTWNGSAYSKAVKTTDLSGSISASQLANNSVTADKIASGSITAAKMATGLEPVTVVTSLPTTKSTSSVVFNNELYTWDGSKYSKAVKAVDITGTLSTTQIANNAITVDKIATGAVTANELAAGAVTVAKMASGIEPITIVTSLPTTKSTTNVVFNNELYTWDGSKYSKAVKTTDLTGTVSASQIANNAVTTDKIAAGSISANKFASGIEPVSVVTSLPTTKSTTNVVFNNELYTWNGTAYSKAVKAADISGQLAAAQIAALEASKITGTITGTQIADNSISTGKIAANAITAAKIATGTITANELAANSVTTAKIAAGAVTATEVAAKSITADKLVISNTTNLFPDPLFNNADAWNLQNGASFVSTTGPLGNQVKALTGTPSTNDLNQAIPKGLQDIKVAAGEVYGFRIVARRTSDTAAGSVRIRVQFKGGQANNNDWPVPASVNLATAAKGEWVTATGTLPTQTNRDTMTVYVHTSGATGVTYEVCEVGMFSMTTGELIVNGSVTADKIAANTITATQIAAGTITANQLASNSVTAVKVAANAITADKIAANAVTADKIAANSVTAAKIAAATITAAEIATGTITTKQLAVADITNLMQDAESNTLGKFQFLQASSVIAYTTNDYNGATLRTIRLSAATAAVHAATYPDIPVIGGQQMYFEVLTRSGGTARWNGTDASKIAIMAGAVEVAVVSLKDYEPRFGFVKKSVEFVVPDGVTSLSVQIHTDSTVVGSNMEMSAFTLRKRFGGELIVDGAITADKIAANTITASKLVVSDTSNIIPDSELRDASAWTFDVAGWQIAEASSYETAERVLRFTGSLTGAQNGFAGSVRTQAVACSPGETFFASVVFRSHITGTEGLMELRLNFITKDGSELTKDLGVFTAGVSTAETVLSGIAVVPADVVSVYYRLRMVHSANGVFKGTVYAYRPVLRRAASSELIVDGAITTDKLTANSVTTAKIATNAVTANEINANAVTAAKIAANAVTADKINANAVTAAKISAGAITADKLAVNSVTAASLVISDTTNLLPDSGLESLAKGTWYSSTASGSIERYAGTEGNGVLIKKLGTYTGEVNAFTSSFRSNDSENFIPVVAGTILRTTCTVKLVAGTVSGNVGMYSEVLKRDGTRSAVNPNALVGLSGKEAGHVQTVTGIYTIPADVVGIRHRAVFGSASNSALAEVAVINMSVRRVSEGNLIVDGAITTDHLTANSVTTAKIATNAVTANEIAANAVTAAKIAANAVTADKITANAVTTAKIAAGAVTAAEIAAGAVTASKLTVIDTSTLIPDSDYMDTSAWTWDTGLAVSFANDTNGNTGTGSGRAAKTSYTKVNGGTAYLYMTTADTFGISVGKTYVVRAQVYTAAASVAQIVLRMYTSANVETTYVYTFTTTAGWGRYEFQYTIPGLTPKARLSIGPRVDGGGSFMVGKIIFREAVDTAVIVDGAITADKIVTNAITADKISANAVTTAKINTGAVTANELATNSVTAVKIAANAVTADKIAANSITAAKIAAGAITASELAAGSVTAKQLVLSDPENLFSDPNFDLFDSGYWYNSVSATNATATRYVGNEGVGILFTKLGSFTSEIDLKPFEFMDNLPIRYKSVKAGDVLRVQCKITRKAGASGGNVGIHANLLSDAGTVSSASVNGTTGATPLGGTVTVNTTYTVPEGIVGIKFRIYYGSSTASTGGSVAITDISVRRVANADLIVDGAITADKIATNAITADKINGGVITAIKLASNSVTAVKIAANAVTADKIEANAITADKLAANSVTAVKIAAGAITADKIAANTITADKLLIGSGTNLIYNGPHQQRASVGWAQNLVWVDGDFPTGQDQLGGSFKSATATTVTPLTATNPVDVIAGKKYRLEFWMKADKANSRVYVEFRDAVGGLVGGWVTPGYTASSYPLNSAIVPTTWTKIVSTLTVAQTCRSPIRLEKIYFNHSNGTEKTAVQQFAGFALYALEDGELIVDGAITTEKLVANSVTTAKIATGAVTANEIASNAITAVKIAANAVTADKITANAVTTAKIATGAVTANEIAANAITADKVAAKSITVDKLVVSTSENLIPDPYFDNYPVGWITTNATKVSVAGPDGETRNAVRFKLASDTTPVNSVVMPSGSQAPEVPTDATYKVRAVVRLVSGTSGSIRLRACYFKNYSAARQWPNITPNNPATGKTPGEWFTLEATYKVPAGFNHLGFSIHGTGGDGTTEWEACEFSIFRMAGSELIVDGAITADKIAANAITADKIAANAISANMIQAGTITADKLVLSSTSNMVPDPKFENPDAWTIEGAANKTKPTFVEVTGPNNYTVKALRCEHSGSQGNVVMAVPKGLRYIRARGGETYRFYIVVRRTSATATGSGRILLSVDGGTSTTTLWVTSAAVNLAQTATNVWGTATAQFTMPEGRELLSVHVHSNGSADFTMEVCEVGMYAVATGELIVDGAITADKLATNSVTTAKINAGAVTANEIAANAVTADKITANAVTTAKIAAGAVTANEIAATTITAAKIATGTITATQLASNSVTAVKIAANAVTADKIAANSITAAKIAAGTITATQLAAGSVTAKQLVLTDTENLIQDANFDMIAEGAWHVSNATEAQGLFERYAGPEGVGVLMTKVGTYSGNFTVRGENWRDNSSKNFVTVNPGDILRILCKVTRKSGVSGGNVGIYADRLLTAGTVSGTNIGGYVTSQPLNETVVVNKTYTIPAGTIGIRFRIIFDSNANDPGGSVAITDIAVRRMNNADMIVDGAITTNKLAANSVTANAIAAGAITANKLAVMDYSTLVPDPEYSDSTAWSSESLTTHSFVTIADGEASTSNGRVAKLVVAYDNTTNYNAFYGKSFPISGGRTYQLRFRIKTDAAAYIKARVALYGSGQSNINRDKDYNITQAGWTEVDYQFEVPTTHRTARFYVYIRRNSSSAEFYVSKVTINEATGATTIVNGAITTDKISANAITAAKIASGTITATQLAANAVTADKLAANSVTAAKLAANSIAVGTAAIQTGAITNAHIANLAADKITAGSLAVGSYLQSSNYVAGTTGWRIHADGTADMQGLELRGNIYASGGKIGAFNIGSKAIYSGSLGNDYAWTTTGNTSPQSGIHISDSGILIQGPMAKIEIGAYGYFSVPGLVVDNGIATLTQANIVNKNNIRDGEVSSAVSAWTATGLSNSSTSTSWSETFNISQCSVNSTGGKLVIHGSVTVDAVTSWGGTNPDTTSASLYMQLVRSDGAVLLEHKLKYTSAIEAVSTGSGSNSTARMEFKTRFAYPTIIDQPSAGYWTYTLRLRVSSFSRLGSLNGARFAVTELSQVILEVKR